METLTDRQQGRSSSFAITLVFLVGMAVGLAILLGMILHGVAGAEGASRKLLSRLAWISMAMLGLTLVMLFWIVAHYLMGRFRPQGHQPTEYVDAWKLAGQRVKPPQEPPGDEDPDE